MWLSESLLRHHITPLLLFQILTVVLKLLRVKCFRRSFETEETCIYLNIEVILGFLKHLELPLLTFSVCGFDIFLPKSKNIWKVKIFAQKKWQSNPCEKFLQIPWKHYLANLSKQRGRFGGILRSREISENEPRPEFPTPSRCKFPIDFLKLIKQKSHA